MIISYWAAQGWLNRGVAARVRLEVADGRFVRVQTDCAPRPEDRRLDGLVLPGLANAHSHAFHRALRGRTHAGGGTFWTWREQMYALADRLDPDRYFQLARAVYAEMALAGITVVGEFHYLHHDRRGVRYAEPNAMNDALAAAAAEAGIRLTLLDACYLRGGLSETGWRPLEGVQQRFGDGDADGWAERAAAWTAPAWVAKGAAIHSVRAVSDADLRRLADRFPPGPMHLHLSEQPAENAAVQHRYGCSPTQVLDVHGLLQPRTTVVHATHLAPADIERLAQAGTTACLCPTTERDLADGIGPARALSSAGCPLALGTDQHAVIDPFEEIRGLEMHERLRSGARACFDLPELITAASEAGYRCLGWEKGGVLAAGALADFVVIDTDSVRTTGCRTEQMIYAATAADVRTVVVAGRPVVSGGRHRLGSVPELLRQAMLPLAGQP